MTTVANARNYLWVAASAVLVIGLTAVNTSAQDRSPSLNAPADERMDQNRPRSIAGAGDAADPYFKQIYRTFHESYRLGPDDEIAIRVLGQQDYSIEKAQVSPFGRVYHPLVGDIDVAGLTISQVTEKLTTDLSQYIIDPRVSVSLITANSAKIGVLGDVSRPGIVLMARPMTILDAITASGGVTDLGNKTNVTVLRQIGEGRMRTTTINVKRILEAKATPEENVMLQAGDTVIVHGNFKKTLSTITQLAGFGYFMRILAGQ
jgi:protein involved in polysaccharide export with SLBB domain